MAVGDHVIPHPAGHVIPPGDGVRVGVGLVIGKAGSDRRTCSPGPAAPGAQPDIPPGCGPPTGAPAGYGT
jgi:hypothetical protein